MAVVHPPVLATLAEQARGLLVAGGLEVVLLEVPAGESSKNANIAAACWAALGQAGFTRSDAIVGLGGGATTDLAGFVAATWLRGVRLVNLPTTLLGMVDAAVGGKTGINTAEGKNLVGSFHPPAAVLCDIDLLASLPSADLVSGLGEIVKVRLHRRPGDPRPRRVRPGAGVPAGRRAPARARRAGDPRQGRRRRRPTCASPSRAGWDAKSSTTATRSATPSSRSSRYTWRHGEAVSVGLVYVAELARLAGRLPDGGRTPAPHRARLAGAADVLPCRPVAGAVRGDGARQEDPRSTAAVRGAGRRRPAGTAGRSRSGAAAGGLRGGDSA